MKNIPDPCKVCSRPHNPKSPCWDDYWTAGEPPAYTLKEWDYWTASEHERQAYWNDHERVFTMEGLFTPREEFALWHPESEVPYPQYKEAVLRHRKFRKENRGALIDRTVEQWIVLKEHHERQEKKERESGYTLWWEQGRSKEIKALQNIADNYDTNLQPGYIRP
tara:strand:- start:1924 stop:2418 length:495 start_codon:yes stop_codon:yes gene_type:complete